MRGFRRRSKISACGMMTCSPHSTLRSIRPKQVGTPAKHHRRRAWGDGAQWAQFGTGIGPAPRTRILGEAEVRPDRTITAVGRDGSGS